MTPSDDDNNSLVFEFKIRMSSLITIALILGADPQPIDFAHDVLPILKAHCVECHGGDKAEGGFSLNTRELLLDAKAAVPGNPVKSPLLERVLSTDPDEQMPPKDKPRLTAAQVDVLRRWIQEELPWQEGFTFAAARYEPPLLPRAVLLPPVVDGRANPVDRIVDRYLAEQKQPAPTPLSDASFLRRVYLDLVGLPPTPNQLAAFLADQNSDKRQHVIERLLADNTAYADHWMTFWSDLLRNANSGTGYIDGGRKHITAWLYKSLLENKPYNQFVHELIKPDGESEGFIRGIKWRGNVNASQTREVQFSQNISQVFLGINMKCASCHDSFIDRWTLDEAYGLAAIYSAEPLEIYRCDKPTGEIAKAAWIFPKLGEIDPAAAQPQRLEQLADLMTHPENGRLSRTIVNRLWRQLMGRGIVHPVDAMHTRPWSEDLLDFLANYLVENNYDLKKVLALIANSQAYQSQAVVLHEEPADGFVYAGPIVKRLTAEQYMDAIWEITDTWPNAENRGPVAALLKAQQAADGKPRRVRAVFTALDPLQATLGRPNREQVVTSRPDLLTTLEAIHLANGDRLTDTLMRGAAHLLQTQQDAEVLVDQVFKHALTRSPTTAEAEIARDIVGPTPTQQSVADLLWLVFMLPEFQFIQ